MWNNFYWNNKKSVTNEEKVFFAKYSYTLGDGAKYFSVYYKDKDGKDVWAGYTNASNVKVLKSTEESKYVTLKKDYNTWNNLYFKQHKDDFKASKGVNFKVKRYYTLNGNKFYSTYRVNGDGKEVWTGYVNGYSSVVSDLKATEDKKAMKVTKDCNTYENHFYTKKGQVKPGSVVTMERYYTYVNGKKYASVKDKDGKWLGYVNMDALKVATLETADLEKAVNSIKDTAKNVYMTQDQETKAKDALEKLVKAIPNKDYTSQDEVDAAIKAINDAVKAMNDTLPNKKDGTALNNIIDKANQLETDTKGHVDWLFQNGSEIKAAKEDAEKILTELKKDKENGENTATVEETKEAVKAATAKLEKALNDLEVNADNTEKFMNKAKDAISNLDKDNQATPQKDFDALAATLKEDDSAKNYDDIIKDAKELVNAVDAAQDKELNDVIAKVKRIEGPSTSSSPNYNGKDDIVTNDFEYGKYYEEASFKAMNTELGKAEEAEKLTIKDINTSNMDNKQKEEDALKQDIKELKVKNFETEEKDQTDTIELEKYTGDYNLQNKATREWESAPENVLEIPGMLKDKQVVIPDQALTSEEGDHLFPKHLEEDAAYEKWTFKFVEQDGHKVKASASVRGLFSAKKPLVKVDLTGLDFSDTTDMTSLFSSSPVFKYWTGAEKLVTNKVTSTKSMLWGTNIPNVNAAQWDVSGVTDMQNMFKKSNVETIDMTGWKLNDKVNLGSDDTNMFNGANRLKEITLPTDNESAKKIAETLGKSNIESNVTLKQNGKEVAKYSKEEHKVTSTEEKKEQTAITTDETTLKNPKALARTVMEAKEGDDKAFSNLPEAKQLAAMIYVGEEITAHSESDKAKGIAGIDPNVDWSEFNCESTGRSSLYDAEGLLQNYARNTKAVSLDEINKKLDKLVGNMEGLRVLDNQLAAHTKAVKKLAKEHEAQLKTDKEKSGAEALQKELTTADRFIGSRGYELRGVDNWNEINKLTQNMMAAEKALSELLTQK